MSQLVSTATRPARTGASVSSAFHSSWLSLFLFLMATWVTLGLLLGSLASSARALSIAKQFNLITLASGGLWLVIVLAGCFWCTRSDRALSDRNFVLLIAGLWVASRCVIILSFPNYVLTGDEDSLHRFVVNMATGGLSAASLGRLNSYDFPIWLTRGLPIYYPLRLLFGEHDLGAVRLVNAVCGAGTAVFTFLIARRITNSATARVSAWLLLVFPYHVFGVLDYVPEIPGTLFFVAGIWMVQRQLDGGKAVGKPVAQGLLLGVLLALMGIVRNGLDTLLAVITVVLALYSINSLRKRRTVSHAGVVLVCALLIWLPARYAVGQWVASRDLHPLRSQVLGFLTRGSNPVSMGEYLARYEQLDAATPKPEKSRVLLSVVATEAVREPVVTLVAVPLAKTVKVFLAGYSAAFETGLKLGGYERAALLTMGARATFAVVLLWTAVVGILPATYRFSRALRYRVVIVAIAASSAALVLLWEASPRYSHAVHFGFVVLAAAGFVRLQDQRLGALKITRGAIFQNGKSVAVLAVLAIIVAGCIYAAARVSRSHQFVNVQDSVVALDGGPIAHSPLHPRTRYWEQQLDVPSGHQLPSTLTISASNSPGPVEVSLWAPDDLTISCSECRVGVKSSDGGSSTYSMQQLSTMKRTTTPVDQKGSFTIALLPPPGTQQQVLEKPLHLAFGYVLSEPTDSPAP